MASPPPYSVPYQTASSEPKGLELWARYFAHGALFALMTVLAALLWLIVTIPLVLCGAFIGLAIALFIMVMMYGYINTALNEWIWGRTMEHKWSSVFVHGLVVILVLMAAAIPSFVIQAVVPDPLVAIVLFVIYCFVDGIIGKWAGGMWMRTPRRPVMPGYYNY